MPISPQQRLYFLVIPLMLLPWDALVLLRKVCYHCRIEKKEEKRREEKRREEKRREEKRREEKRKEKKREKKKRMIRYSFIPLETYCTASNFMKMLLTHCPRLEILEVCLPSINLISLFPLLLISLLSHPVLYPSPF